MNNIITISIMLVIIASGITYSLIDEKTNKNCIRIIKIDGKTAFLCGSKSLSVKNRLQEQTRQKAIKIVDKITTDMNTKIQNILSDANITAGSVMPYNTYQPTFPEVDIHTVCTRKWTKRGLMDYSMIKYCIDGQKKAEQESRHKEVDLHIRIFCTQKWSHDWTMYDYCIKKQTAAKMAL